MKNISNEPAIIINNVSKEYRLGDSVDNQFLRNVFSQFFNNLVRKKNVNSPEKFKALDNINITINKGESFGIIGPNGAGKSTLLKILSRITYPTTGEALLNGRVASLLEVGTGFNPDLTGRENIFLNGAILGMTKQEIISKFSKIVEFSEVGKFLDTPVKRYSSGMYIRLAFSIAAHLDPEILVIDEVLAVGDAKFQQKSLGKMDQVTKGKDRTIVFVSHDLGAIKKICQRCALIDKGKVVSIGKTEDVIEEYLDRVEKSIGGLTSGSDITRTGSGKIIIKSVVVLDEKDNVVNHVSSGEKIKLQFTYDSQGKYSKVNLSFSIHTTLSQNIILHQSKYTLDYFSVKKGRGKIIFEFMELPLISGTYLINLRVDINGEEADFPRTPMYKLRVIDGDYFKTKMVPLQHSPVLIKGKWNIVQ